MLSTTQGKSFFCARKEHMDPGANLICFSRAAGQLERGLSPEEGRLPSRVLRLAHTAAGRLPWGLLFTAVRANQPVFSCIGTTVMAPSSAGENKAKCVARDRTEGGHLASHQASARQTGLALAGCLLRSSSRCSPGFFTAMNTMSTTLLA